MKISPSSPPPPTFKPQTEIAIHRLDARLSRNLVLHKEFKRRSGHIYRVRKARTFFLSADPSANVVGATAWPLLVINEAQDVLPAIYDKRFAPMAAAHNATRLFSGTAWTSNTLLAREERVCRLKQEADGKRRVFIATGSDIASVHPPYGQFLESKWLASARTIPSSSPNISAARSTLSPACSTPLAAPSSLHLPLQIVCQIWGGWPLASPKGRRPGGAGTNHQSCGVLGRRRRHGRSPAEF